MPGSQHPPCVLSPPPPPRPRSCLLSLCGLLPPCCCLGALLGKRTALAERLPRAPRFARAARSLCTPPRPAVAWGPQPSAHPCHLLCTRLPQPASPPPRRVAPSFPACSLASEVHLLSASCIPALLHSPLFLGSSLLPASSQLQLLPISSALPALPGGRDRHVLSTSCVLPLRTRCVCWRCRGGEWHSFSPYCAPSPRIYPPITASPHSPRWTVPLLPFGLLSPGKRTNT